MRFRSRHVAAALAAAVVGLALSGCKGSDLPVQPNGPSGQFFSTNNALLRIVNGSPTAGSACTPAGIPTKCVDVYVDGSLVAAGVPYPAVSPLDAFGILPYISVPAGQALIQIYQAGTRNLVYGLPVAISAGKKYSFVLAGNVPLPPPAPPFFPGYLFADGLYNSLFGNSMADFHNASFNAGPTQFSVACSACASGGQSVGNAAGPGGVVGPVNLAPASGYSFSGKSASATSTLAASQMNGLNTSNVIPDPFGRPNVSIYAVDTVGASTSNFQLIGIEDLNG